MKKISKTILILFSLVLITSCITIQASERNVKKNDIIITDSGKEQVIEVLPDGRFITEEMNSEGGFSYAVNSRAVSCMHTDIVGLGNKYKETQSYNKTDATYCYKYRYYEIAKCAKCGKTGYKIYDASWTKVKHKYSWFGKTCNECGYTK